MVQWRGAVPTGATASALGCGMDWTEVSGTGQYFVGLMPLCGHDRHHVDGRVGRCRLEWGFWYGTLEARLEGLEGGCRHVYGVCHRILLSVSTMLLRVRACCHDVHFAVSTDTAGGLFWFLDAFGASASF